MKIVVFSLTGNCKRFVDMCKIPEEDVIDLFDIDYEVDFDYILITPTIGFGQVPEGVTEFLETNHKHLKGVVGSGNKNWVIDLLKLQRRLVKSMMCHYL